MSDAAALMIREVSLHDLEDQDCDLQQLVILGHLLLLVAAVRDDLAAEAAAAEVPQWLSLSPTGHMLSHGFLLPVLLIARDSTSMTLLLQE